MFRGYTEVFRTPVASTNKSSESPNPPKTCKCEFCDQEWESESEVYIHKRKHFNNKHPKKIEASKDSFCWTCIRKFNTQPDLIEHFKQCHLLSSQDANRVEHQIYVCDYCSAVLFNKKMLAIHIAYLHCGRKVKRRLDCPNCPRMIDVTNFWNHFYIHNMMGMYMCPICFLKFPDWNNLKDHLDSHPPYLHCDLCGNNYDSKSAFNQHFEQHKYAPTEPERIKIEEIDTYDKYFVGMSTHMKSWKLQPHRGLTLPKELSICVLCREICMTDNEQRQHILKHQNFKQEQVKKETIESCKLNFTCSCGQIFFNRILLKQHLLRNKESEHFHCSV